jgi:hypothetical protein
MTKTKAPISRRAILVGATSATALGTSGCFGSFGLTSMLYDWNAGVDNKWLRWLLFLAIGVILPVYGITLIVDALVLNSLEFWTGSNPVSNSEGPIRVASSKTSNPDVIRHEVYEHDKKIAVLYAEKVNDHEIRILDASGRTITCVRGTFDGGLELLDEQERQLAVLDADDVQDAAAAVRAGQQPRAVMLDKLAETGQLTRVTQAHAGLEQRVML